MDYDTNVLANGTTVECVQYMWGIDLEKKMRQEGKNGTQHK